MFIQEVAEKLVEEGVGALNVVIFLSSGAQFPANAPSIVIVDTGGAGSMRTQNNTAVQVATASLTTRALNFKDAYALAALAYLALGGADGLYNTTLSGVSYLSLNARQQPTDLGSDGSTGLSMVVFNIEAEKQPS